jgi:FkbM family methyltransferase
MVSVRTIGATLVKEALWHTLRPFNSGTAWPMRVRSGYAEGVTLVIDLRRSATTWLGTYDRWILDNIRIADWLPVGGVAWDCGSYLGFYAAIFRRVVGDTGRVIAFEASLSNYEPLSRVPGLNGWSNVEILNRAVGPDHAVLNIAGELGGSSGPVETKVFNHPVVTRPVACSGVDELCFEHGVQQPDFIKFDIEGAETYALTNGHRLFTEKRPVVLLELHGDEALSALGVFIEKYSYRCWDVRFFNQLETDPFTKASQLEHAASRLSNTMVCLPTELLDKRSQVLGKGAG